MPGRHHRNTHWGPRDPSDAAVYATLAKSRAVVYTPTVCCPFREVQSDIARLITRVGVCVENHVCREEFVEAGPAFDRAELLIVDEAERLSNTCLEHLRDLFDRSNNRRQLPAAAAYFSFRSAAS